MLFKKSQHGWRLVLQSMALLREQKEIWILPLIGRGFMLILITALSVLVALIRSGKIDYQSFSGKEILWGYAVIFTVLWLGNVVLAYYNAAMVGCLLQLNKGEKISLSAALRIADQRFGTILTWIIMHFTFGGFVTLFRSKATESKSINQLLSGLNWTFASFLMSPLIVSEGAGFFQTLQRSSNLISQTAGQNPRLNFSYVLLSLLLRLIAMIPFTIGLYSQHSLWIAVGGAISFLLILIISVIMNSMLVTIGYAHYEFLAHHHILRHFKAQDIATILKK